MKIRVIVDNVQNRIHREYQFDSPDEINWQEQIEDMVTTLQDASVQI